MVSYSAGVQKVAFHGVTPEARILLSQEGASCGPRAGALWSEGQIQPAAREVKCHWHPVPPSFVGSLAAFPQPEQSGDTECPARSKVLTTRPFAEQ